MARGRKKKDAVEKVIQMGRSELKDAIVEASRHKANAASYTGYHGTTVKNFCERTSFDRTVFGWLRKLYDLGDELKQKAMIRQFLMGVDLMDWGQKELFDDVQEEIANRVKKAPTEDDDKDLRPPFLQNAMPLDEAKEKFDAALEVAEAKKAVAAKAAAKSKPADALSALAGEEPATAH